MAPHPRSARNFKLPAGLRDRDGYFSWKHPHTGKEYGLGRDRAQAVADAIEANLHAAGELKRARLVDRLTGAASGTVGDWLDIYAKQLTQRTLANSTRNTYASLDRLLRSEIGADSMIERVTTRDSADALTRIEKRGHARTAQSFRSFGSDAFRAAVAEGWINSNPFDVVRKVEVKVQRARLTLDVYLQVRGRVDGWLRNAMDLALVSAQRREDISRARFADVHDEAWFCEQRKTCKRVCIPLELRLDKVGMSLVEVVRACRSTGVLSKHLVHQTAPRGNSPVGRQIWQDTITKRFSAALAQLQIDFGAKTPPTFHEIRSLAARLYTEQGNVDVRELLGHSDEQMTSVYRDARGAEWVRVKIA